MRELQNSRQKHLPNLKHGSYGDDKIYTRATLRHCWHRSIDLAHAGPDEVCRSSPFLHTLCIISQRKVCISAFSTPSIHASGSLSHRKVNSCSVSLWLVSPRFYCWHPCCDRCGSGSGSGLQDPSSCAKTQTQLEEASCFTLIRCLGVVIC